MWHFRFFTIFTTPKHFIIAFLDELDNITHEIQSVIIDLWPTQPTNAWKSIKIITLCFYFDGFPYLIKIKTVYCIVFCVYYSCANSFLNILYYIPQFNQADGFASVEVVFTRTSYHAMSRGQNKSTKGTNHYHLIHS